MTGRDESDSKCGYYIERKKRHCRMTVGRGALFCGEHGNGERIPCPLDPKHSCFRATIKKHLNKCNARRQEKPSFLVPQINTVSTQEPLTVFPSLSELSDSELSELVMKIQTAFNNIPECEKSIMMHDIVKPSLDASDCGAKARKHLLQNASLLGNISKEKFLENETTFVEFGAGRGQLSFWLGEVLQGRNCKLLLVDRASNRHKLDNKLKDGDISVTRVRADIADLELALLLPSSAHIVGICKHLCGEATDLSLRCLLRAVQAGMHVDGLIMAPCCHHRCSWNNFVGRSYLESTGFSEYVFKALCGISSWATCGTGRPRSTLNVENTPQAIHVDRYMRLGYDQEKRRLIGRMAKMILNFARLKYVENHNLVGKLIYYTEEAVSPENVCYMAKFQRT